MRYCIQKTRQRDVCFSLSAREGIKISHKTGSLAIVRKPICCGQSGQRPFPGCYPKLDGGYELTWIWRGLDGNGYRHKAGERLRSSLTVDRFFFNSIWETNLINWAIQMNKTGQSLIIEQPLPIRKQVYEYLRDQILNHVIEDSSRLIEAQIAKTLGISRTPVREALHLLEKDGFLESVPRVGYRMKRLDANELAEIVEIRKVNESLACRWALERINKKDLAQLENNLNATRKMLKDQNPVEFVRYDEEFHEILVGASRCNHLAELCQQLRRLMLRYRSESMTSMKSAEQAFQGHVLILEKLKQKDEQGLAEALINHLHFSRENIRKTVLNR